MCASYFAWPSASVSTRTIVPPETLASAAACTLASVSPVRSVSSLRWPPQGWRPVLGGAAASVVVDVAAAADAECECRDDCCLCESAALHLPGSFRLGRHTFVAAPKSRLGAG